MKGSFWQRGGAWVLAQSGLMLAALAVAPVWRGTWVGVWTAPLAGVLVALGAAFGLGGVWVLGRNRTIFPEPTPESKLVRSGVFALVRHPLYTSVILLALAWAIGWHSGPGLAPAALLAVFLDAKSRHEEQRLRTRFPAYAEYARGVKRLVPWIY